MTPADLLEKIPEGQVYTPGAPRNVGSDLWAAPARGALLAQN